MKFSLEKNCVFINDSKATTFQAYKNFKKFKIYFWIVGGFQKTISLISHNLKEYSQVIYHWQKCKFF